MPNIIIAGAQWGDEGKGKVVDLLTDRVQVVVRFNGGHNAGHTIRIGEEKFVTHLVPSGIFHPGILCIVGNGCVVDPWALEKEIGELRARGVSIEDNLVFSDRAQLILPHHTALEAIAEQGRGSRNLGTTKRGIGPSYEDKVARRGLRLCDLLRPAEIPAKLADARRHYEDVCRGEGVEATVDWDALHRDLTAFGERHRTRIQDASLVLHRQITAGYSVLFEGAQSTHLDIDHGSYPYVTSSSGTVGGAVVGAGVPCSAIDGSIGVVKAYTTRVGTGPLPTEIGGAAEEAIRERGREYGASTGRPRRCGWFDAVVARYSVRVNGFDTLALTKLDVLDELDEVPVCTAYTFEGTTLTELPADAGVMERCVPVYETLPGWKTSTVGIHDFNVLPPNAQKYVERIQQLAGCEVGIVSTGPDRNETILRSNSAIASWFA